MKTLLESTLTCPQCGFQKTETMPTDACVHFYPCAGCGALLKPRAGDCCVFCSYGSVKCPPRQAEEDCCASDGLSKKAPKSSEPPTPQPLISGRSERNRGRGGCWGPLNLQRKD